ncbi:MAG: hypothetical protein ACFB0B_10810 [Thermonemataceae bacterium]
MCQFTTLLPKLLLPLCLLLTQSSFAQVEQGFPPQNPFLADSPWATYHKDSYRQAATPLKGPTATDQIKVKTIEGIQGGTSPWTYLSEKYPNGQRILLQSNATHVYKIADDDKGFRIVAKRKIDSDWLKSFGWNFLQTKDHIWYTYDPKYNPKKKEYTRLFKLTDAVKGDPYADIKLVNTFNFGDYGIHKVQHFGINYAGQIVFASDNDKGASDCIVGVISSDFQLLDTLRIKTKPNEFFGHNAFPIDENNRFYLVTTQRLIAVQWEDNKLQEAFEAAYDFVGDGPTGRYAEGSGTTPTLMGFGEGNDQLIIVADGHEKNNLVAFWRVIPEGWQGKQGYDKRVAGVMQLPAAERFSNLFQSIENSPTVFGYEVAVAQFNGFLGQGNKPRKGVQKLRWNTQKDQFELVWVNREVNINGVLTYSKGSNLVYGSGREDDCKYYYYGLDWETGKVAFKQFLGKSCKKLKNPYDDGGCNNIIDEEGNIYFAGGASLVKLEKQ